MIADMTQGGGGAEEKPARERKISIDTAAAQLSAALLDHKQAQLRLDNCRLAIEEALAHLRKAQR